MSKRSVMISTGAVTDGDYRTYATSADETVPEEVTQRISGTAADLIIDGIAVSVTIDEPGPEYTLCPPATKGAVRPLDAPITVGTLTLTRPAVFGDCGATSPSRITIVDLDSVDVDSGVFPFGRWVEMCDVTDPDC